MDDRGGREVDYKETLRGDRMFITSNSVKLEEKTKEKRELKKKRKKLKINKHHPNKPEIQCQ